jgi:hypothetical protein
MHTGSKFDSTTRYVYLYITLSCCMMFAGTSFILWPVAAVIYFLTYLSDKYLLLNFHPKSNTSNEEQHIYYWYKYYNITIVLYLIVSIWSFYVFNLEMMPLYGMDGEKGSTTWDRIPGLAHVIVLTIVVLARNVMEFSFLCTKWKN